MKLGGLFGEYVDELFSDDVALLFRVGDSGKLVQEAVDGVDIDEFGSELVAEHLDDLFGFAFAEQAVVHVHADQVFAYGLDEQCGDYRRINSAREGEEYFTVPNLAA